MGYGADAGLSSLVGVSVVISSIGFGGGVVAIVQPIQAPMKSMATKATKTGIAIIQNCASLSASDEFPIRPIV